MAESPETIDISVCVANYNGGELVLDCLRSVQGQDGDFSLEVIVHDDVSSDGSAQAIRQHFPRVRFLQGTENVGFCISNNRMVAEARGRYVLLLNNDAVLRPGSLRALLEFADSGHADCLLGLPQHSMTDNLLIDRGYRTDPFLNPIPAFESGTREVGVATGACLWIPRNVWDEVGGFPPWFESVAEDIFMCLAARLLGRRVFVLDGPAFDHWIGRNLGGGKLDAGKLRSTVRRRALSERNKTYTMLCCYPLWMLVLLLPAHALSLAAEAIFLLLTGTSPHKVSKIYLQPLAGTWHHRKRIAALRQHLMRAKRAGARKLFAFTTWMPAKLVMLLRHGRPRLD